MARKARKPRKPRKPRNRQPRLPAAEYEAYINSMDWWRKRRQYRRSRYPQFCLVCKSPRFQLHHRTYKNLGRERVSGLVPLCDVDHEAFHVFYEANKKPGYHLWQATSDFLEQQAGIRCERRRYIFPEAVPDEIAEHMEAILDAA